MEKSPRRTRSGYEPSDTENEEHGTPWRETDLKLRNAMPRNVSPLRFSRRQSSRLEYEVSPPARGSMVSPPRRRHLSTKSPLKTTRDDGRAVSPLPGLDLRKNISALPRAEGGRRKSPYRGGAEESNLVKNDFVGSSRRHSRRTPTRDVHGAYPKVLEITGVSEKTNHRRRYATAPRLRGREEDRKKEYGQTLQREEIAPTPSPNTTWKDQEEASHPKEPSIGELNEMVAMVRLASDRSNALVMESMDSISAGDIFFSRDHTVLAMQKRVLSVKNGFPGHFSSNPDTISSTEAAAIDPQLKATDNLDLSVRDSSTKMGLSQTTITSSSARSGKNSSKLTKQTSKRSDATGITSGSFRKFTDNMMKSQNDGWLACIRKGNCRTSRSPEHRPIDESAFIARALVVENLRKFWADKHQPASLNGFTCHKQEAQLLLKIVSRDVCPNILFKGPLGSGKRALTMALLREIYGDACWNLTHELRYFLIQEKRPMQVVVPITSSTHHVELNIKREAHARYALMGIVKEISSKYAITPEVSNVNPKPDYKVIVLFDVDKASENLQHLIKWIMDCYPDACRLILCCEDDAEILELVKTRCKVIKVDAPVTHEIIDVLTQIARKENFDLPTNFAAKIASKSKQNLRQAIMALEACKAHNYPFIYDQPIPLGWEEVLVELAADILADPSQQRLYSAREKLQQLLLDFVHPNLILQKLVEQFLKRVEGNTRRELYYYHAYYSKKLPTGTTALLKLEEFVAKFMSIYRRSSNNHQNV